MLLCYCDTVYAAAIAFNAQNEDRDRKRCVLVFDLGGGTFDVTIVEIEGWNPPRVLATGGSTELGGSDFDARIYEQAISDYYDLDIQVPDQDAPDWALMENCEKAKIALSELDHALINNTSFPSASFDLKYKDFVKLCEHHFAAALSTTKDVMARAGLDRSQIEEILLVGGSTKIRRIREKLAENFPQAKIRDDIDPMLAVAQGAALLADFLSKKSIICEDSTDDSSSFISFHDVAPFHLGMRLAGDKYQKLVERNTPIPFTTCQRCENANDNDTVLKIEILEGEATQASKNDVLAKVEIEVTPKPAGENDIKVVVSIDNSGILSVSAIDLDTNKEVSVTVTAM